MGFQSVYGRFGSSATKGVEAGPWCMSALPRKRPPSIDMQSVAECHKPAFQCRATLISQMEINGETVLRPRFIIFVAPYCAP